FDDEILTLDVAMLAQPLSQCIEVGRVECRGSRFQHADAVGTLRSRREWPSRHAGEKCDELAALYHSITSSARARKDSGIVRPIAFAALTLTTSSNLVA